MGLVRSFIAALFVSACGAGPAATAGGPATPAAPRPLPVWSVESPDGRVSTVLGTMHLGIGLDEVLPGSHRAALEGARAVLVEMDLSSTDPAALMAHTVLPPDADLRAMLPDAIWPRLLEALGPEIPEAALHRLKPWAVMSMLMSRDASRLEAEREGGQESEGGAPSLLDLEVIQLARGRGVAVTGLETIEEQAAMMDSLPLPAIVAYIEATVTGAPEEGPTLRELTAAYVRGDLTELEAIVFDPDELGRSPELFEALLFDRNDRWIDRVEAAMREGQAFVAVGLAHVIGERGLLRLLEARGYRTTRLLAESPA